MSKNQLAQIVRAARRLPLFISWPLMMVSTLLLAQSGPESPYLSRVNTLGIFGAYSHDSSHILLGDSERRQLLEFGVVYNRRLVLNHIINWQYSGELLPVDLESDPMTAFVNYESSPAPGTYTGTEPYPMVTCTPFVQTYSESVNGVTYSGTQITYCSGRRWTMGEGISPAGFQWNFRPSHKTQPFLTGHGGYIYSTKPIPIVGAGSFNFTFDFGAGFELYRSRTKSIRAEYRFHHISNKDSAYQNPGIDNGLLQITYAFGR